MRILLLCLLIIPCCFSISAQEEIPTLQYQKGIKLDSIPYPGNTFTFIQHCTQLLDTVITSGNIVFLKSRVAKVRKCDVEFHVREGILTQFGIVTYKVKATEKLIHLLTTQLNTPQEVPVETYRYYTWIGTKNEKSYLATLLVDPEGKGRMTLQEN